MTQIAGVVLGDRGGDLAKRLSLLAEASRPFGHGPADEWTDGQAGLLHVSNGAVNTEPQPVQSKDGRYASVFCGTVAPRTNVQPFLAGESSHGHTLNGVFSLARWDGVDRCLTITGDRYGLRPMYYYHDAASGDLVFSSRLRGVVDAGPADLRPDWDALSCLLHFGHFLGEDTHWRAIRRLPQGAVLVWRDGQIRIAQHWRMADISVDESITPEAAVEGIAQLFRQAVTRLHGESHGREVLMLSGGMDSRRIAGELARLDARPDCYTAGWDGQQPNILSAGLVAEALGLPWQAVYMPARGLMRTYWPRTARWTDYETKLHQWITPLVEQLPTPGRINYDGMGGDIPLNGARRGIGIDPQQQMESLRSRDLDQVARQVAGPRTAFDVFSRDLRSRLSWEAVCQGIRRELEISGDTPNRLIDFHVRNRTRRGISPFSMSLLARRCETLFPFFENAFFDFVMSIPPALKIAQPLRKQSLDVALPELRPVPFEGDVRPAGGLESWQAHPLYRRERKRFFLSNVRRHVVGRNWAMDNSRCVPRILAACGKGLVGRPMLCYVFTESFLLFYEFLGEYGPEPFVGASRGPEEGLVSVRHDGCI